MAGQARPAGRGGGGDNSLQNDFQDLLMVKAIFKFFLIAITLGYCFELFYMLMIFKSYIQLKIIYGWVLFDLVEIVVYLQ